MQTILGLDVGGANLKAATNTGRALSVPFAVWKQPEKLPAAIADLVKQFPEAEGLAATMTAELCDCYETKRIGVKAIVEALEAVNKKVRIWSTDGEFVTAAAAKKHHMKVAAANWHALATFAGRFVKGHAILLDIGTTTTDVIVIKNGRVSAKGKTDYERLRHGELYYTGWKRTSVMGVDPMAAKEHFATMQDVYLILGQCPADSTDTDTADGRPATKPYALARLARTELLDLEEATESKIRRNALRIAELQTQSIRSRLRRQRERIRADATLILSGSGEFLVRAVLRNPRWKAELQPFKSTVRLADQIGDECASAGPAYAVAVLATETL